MSYVDGTNCITIAEDGIRNMLAGTAEFRDWAEAVDVERALEKVFVDEIREPNKAFGEVYEREEWLSFFPHVIIEPPADGVSATVVHYATGTQLSYAVQSLSFILRFERYENRDCPGDMRRFKNEVGRIMEAIQDVSNQNFGFSTTGPVERPQRGEYLEFVDYGPVLMWAWSLQRAIA